MKHPFDKANENNEESTDKSRRALLGKAAAALPFVALAACGRNEAASKTKDGDNVTTAIGESGRFTTKAVGEEGGDVTTQAVGEEGGGFTTEAVGEEGGDVTTQAVGEEGGGFTTEAVGEEGGDGVTTKAVGEEGGEVTTQAVGEEGGSLWVNKEYYLGIGTFDINIGHAVTTAVGESGGPTRISFTTDRGSYAVKNTLDEVPTDYRTGRSIRNGVKYVVVARFVARSRIIEIISVTRADLSTL